MKPKQHDGSGYGSGDGAFNGHGDGDGYGYGDCYNDGREDFGDGACDENGVGLHHDCCHWDGKSHG